MSGQSTIHPVTSAPPLAMPPGYVGPLVLPGSNRTVWWTGRVAIGLRFERHAPPAPLPESAERLQRGLLRRALAFRREAFQA